MGWRLGFVGPCLVHVDISVTALRTRHTYKHRAQDKGQQHVVRRHDKSTRLCRDESMTCHRADLRQSSASR